MMLDGTTGLLLVHLGQTILVAVSVAVIARFTARKNAHLTHALWGLVLLKCVTPPFIASPVGIFSQFTPAQWVASNTPGTNQSDLHVQWLQSAQDPTVTETQANQVSVHALSAGVSSGVAAFADPVTQPNKTTASALPAAGIVGDSIACLWAAVAFVVAACFSCRLLGFVLRVRRLRKRQSPEPVPF